MKKLIAMVLVAALCFGICACKSENSSSSESQKVGKEDPFHSLQLGMTKENVVKLLGEEDSRDIYKNQRDYNYQLFGLPGTLCIGYENGTVLYAYFVYGATSEKMLDMEKLSKAAEDIIDFYTAKYGAPTVEEYTAAIYYTWEKEDGSHMTLDYWKEVLEPREVLVVRLGT